MRLSTIMMILSGLLFTGALLLVFGGEIARLAGVGIGAIVLLVLFLFVREIERCNDARSH